MSKRKATSQSGSNAGSSQPRSIATSRVVYSEFGPGSQPAATERATPDLPPNQQQIRVQTSRKGRKGKTVTIVSGFQTSADKLNALLKQLKAQCGTGGTLKDDTIEIQGDHAEKLVQLLQQQGYKAKISGG